MKSKTKIALLSTALTCSVLGMAGATTFAWFTAQKTFAMNFSSITVGASATSLEVSVYPIRNEINDSMDAIAITAASTDLTTDFHIRDVSSKFGKYFVKNEGSFQLVNSDTLGSYVAQFGIAVKNLASLNEETLQMTCNWSAKNANHAASVKLTDYIRSAVIECRDNTFATYVANGKQHAFVKSANDNLAFKNYDDANGVIVDGTYQDNEYTIVNNAYDLATVSAETTHYYRIAVWMDGMIAANQDDARGGSIAYSLNFGVV